MNHPKASLVDKIVGLALSHKSHETQGVVLSNKMNAFIIFA